MIEIYFDRIFKKNMTKNKGYPSMQNATDDAITNELRLRRHIAKC